ncbi:MULTISPECIES: flagellar protein FliS [Sphingomonadaceae]|uniref:flagellar protein FliS n=1 Tax=Sphingomonadaceae TaxID=41297 RepID=UPI00115820E2|nr:MULTISPECIES: flagellar protein FliS [Sphingomonadaceae]QDK34635.1 flagellin [Sphingomonas sp. IC081]QSR16596.1 flagellin [Novosphingobium sp. KA1]
MRRQQNPHEAYRRVDFDARVNGAKPADLVHLCYEHLVSALSTAVHAHGIGDNGLRSRSLTRALTAITALQLGISGESSMAGALTQLYAAAQRTILDSAVEFEPRRIETLRSDFAEIGRALQGG